MEEIRSMTLSEDEPSLKNDFEYGSYGDWEEVAASSLKGGDVSQLLKTMTYEGIEIDPIYSNTDREFVDDGSYPGVENFRRGQSPAGYLNSGWEVCQRIKGADPETFNSELKQGLRSGLNSVFIVPDSVSPNGLKVKNSDDFKRALEGVDIVRYPVVFEPDVRGREFLEFLIFFAKESGADFLKIKGAINFDPLSVFFKTGKNIIELDNYFNEMALMFGHAEEKKMKIKLIGVSMLPYHNSGASAVQELAIALSTGVDYIQAMTERGLSPEQVVKSISFIFGIGSNFFMEISKLRAFRELWNRIVNEYGVRGDSDTIQIHTETSLFNKSALDPYVNVLRATTETFSAVAGGADRITTNPHDSVFSGSNGFSDRIAKNIQMILREESHLQRIIDPAGGSYYVEKLTDDLMKKSWDFFLETDRRGGIEKSIKDGFIEEKIRKNREKIVSDLNRRKKVMVGTNIFSNPDEEIKKRGNLLGINRLSSDFENMRIRVSTLIEDSLLPERIVIALNEPFVKVKAKGDYVKGFFESAGFKAVTVKIGGTHEDKAKRVLSEGSNIVVMCATDEDYPEVIKKIVPELKKGSKEMIIILAGNPGSKKADFIKYGVDIFVHSGVDLLETIDRIIRMSGVKNG